MVSGSDKLPCSTLMHIKIYFSFSSWIFLLHYTHDPCFVHVCSHLCVYIRHSLHININCCQLQSPIVLGLFAFAKVSIILQRSLVFPSSSMCSPEVILSLNGRESLPCALCLANNLLPQTPTECQQQGRLPERGSLLCLMFFHVVVVINKSTYITSVIKLEITILSHYLINILGIAYLNTFDF